MNLHQNLVTIFALFSWPVVALFLYKTQPIARATLWTILGAYMLLPVAADVKFEMIPDLNKRLHPKSRRASRVHGYL